MAESLVGDAALVAQHCTHAAGMADTDGYAPCSVCAVLDCDDSQPCTSDSCADGVCSNTLDAGSCVLVGVCYADNDPNPANECEACVSGTSAISWSAVADDTACTGGTCQAGSGLDLHERLQGIPTRR